MPLNLEDMTRPESYPQSIDAMFRDNADLQRRRRAERERATYVGAPPPLEMSSFSGANDHHYDEVYDRTSTQMMMDYGRSGGEEQYEARIDPQTSITTLHLVSKKTMDIDAAILELKEMIARSETLLETLEKGEG